MNRMKSGRLDSFRKPYRAGLNPALQGLAQSKDVVGVGLIPTRTISELISIHVPQSK